jgi:hypothetical protein
LICGLPQPWRILERSSVWSQTVSAAETGRAKLNRKAAKQVFMDATLKPAPTTAQQKPPRSGQRQFKPKAEAQPPMNTNGPSAAQPQPKRSAGLPTRSRCEGKTVWASPQALAWGAPLRLGGAAAAGWRRCGWGQPRSGVSGNCGWGQPRSGASGKFARLDKICGIVVRMPKGLDSGSSGLELSGPKSGSFVSIRGLQTSSRSISEFGFYPAGLLAKLIEVKRRGRRDGRPTRGPAARRWSVRRD